MGSDLYSILGVAKSANAAEIRKAYRKAALANHPDKNPGDAAAEARFVQISHAYEVLSDDQKRAHYDRFGEEATSSAATSYSGHRSSSATRAARATFNANFGESLAAQWRPGRQVSGTLLRGGTKYTITIYPDGTVEETAAGSMSELLNPFTLLSVIPGMNFGQSSSTGADGSRGASTNTMSLQCALM